MISIKQAFTWLHEFQGSSLTAPDMILRDAIRQKIAKGKFFEAYQAIEYLKSYEKDRLDSCERGEIWLECGIALYDMGNSIEASKSLARAENEFPADSHQHAVARWMLGTVQWFFETDNGEAAKNWMWAIEEFRLLERKAQQDRREREKTWYFERIAEMEESLKERIEKKFS